VTAALSASPRALNPLATGFYFSRMISVERAIVLAIDGSCALRMADTRRKTDGGLQ